MATYDNLVNMINSNNDEMKLLSLREQLDSLYKDCSLEKRKLIGNVLENRIEILNEITIAKTSIIKLDIAISRNRNYGVEAYFKVFEINKKAAPGVPCWRIYFFSATYNTSHSPMEPKPMDDKMKENLYKLLLSPVPVSVSNSIALKIKNEYDSLDPMIKSKVKIPSIITYWHYLIYRFNEDSNDREFISYFTPCPDYRQLSSKY